MLRWQTEKSKSKKALGTTHENRFLDLGFQHLFPRIPLDSNQELRAIYIGSVLTPITLCTGHHKFESSERKYPPFPLLLVIFPQQLTLFDPLRSRPTGFRGAESASTFPEEGPLLTVRGFAGHTASITSFFSAVYHGRFQDCTKWATVGHGTQACRLPTPGLEFSCPKRHIIL